MRALLVATILACVPATADAFCGFYVAPGDQQMLADATQVVLMRSGTRTVLSMQNNYKGPPSDFAMVVPVPVVLQEADVKTLPKKVFEDVERMGAPRLVEYWEQDPCNPYPYEGESIKSRAFAPSSAPKKSAKADDDLGVTIEAQFVVGEYQIVILSAKDSTGLDTWLKREKYKIPDGAEPLLRPYVESGMKFFVAKVDPKKVVFVDGRAELSPLRFHYDTERFELPIRLGLANSSGTQDLIVNILAPNQRYEVANYKNITIPTNIDVKADVKGNFPAFYAALFDRTIEKHPGAVVTEYAWQATTCDPCPGPALNYNDFQTLGADVLAGNTPDTAPSRPMPRGKRPMVRGGSNFVLTRLHARYGKDIKDDLQFSAAPPIVGGREHVVDQATKKLEEGAQPADVNNFQGRYAIRYEWTGAIACEKPQRGIWGGPPGGGRPQTKPALDLAFAPRGQMQLALAIVPDDVPEIGMKSRVLEVYTKPVAPVAAPPTTVPPPVSKGERGCGCQTSDPAGLLGVLGALLIFRPRMRRRRLKGA